MSGTRSLRLSHSELWRSNDDSTVSVHVLASNADYQSVANADITPTRSPTTLAALLAETLVNPMDENTPLLCSENLTVPTW
jgi:hypothetical protein